jgi:hypothetical protein
LGAAGVLGIALQVAARLGEEGEVEVAVEPWL